MIINKIIGILVILLGTLSLLSGLKFDKNNNLHYIPNVRLIGVGQLVFVLGIAFLFTKKTFCEIFELNC